MQTPVTVTVAGRPGPGVAYLLEVTAAGCRLRSADGLAPGLRLTVEAVIRQQRIVLDGVVGEMTDPAAAAPTVVIRWTGDTERLTALLPPDVPPPRRRFAFGR